MSRFDCSFLTRLLQTTALSLTLMAASAAGVHAETVNVGGANGADGANGVIGPAANGGAGGDATAIANSTDPNNAAVAGGGNGGRGGFSGIVDVGGSGGDGGSATATATSSSAGNSTASAYAYGGNGGEEESQICCAGGDPGIGGAANATADTTSRGGTAIATANATAGVFGDGNGFGAANANATATTSLAGVTVQSNAMASSPYSENTLMTFAVAQAGGTGQTLPSSDETAYAVATLSPDQAYAATLIGAATNVADALLGPDDVVFATAILGTNFILGGGYGSATSTFDFTYRGDLLLGLIDDDSVTNLGANVGTLTLGPGVYVIGAVVPEPSTWAMMLVGFAGLTFAGYRRGKAGDTTRTLSLG